MKRTKKYCERCGSEMKYAPVPNDTAYRAGTFDGPTIYLEHGPAYDTKTGAQLLWEHWVCPKIVTSRFLFWKMENPCSEMYGDTVRIEIANLKKKHETNT